ncbi:hypothetical protein [aff. Roholtiella sp. LEGE 12411]|uniref:hypothetical protein n=1 Tax=aff. Roholtiella sp. LEGE 12411 TaxID=1828822 RepID=UPI001882A416|nr:hypothetical protein [aff. Roholtiella sp. LEGE 12411]MBE9035067.1 hypothetical protein [aff. Roholtiella sp. LEGE 12411]
MPHAAYTSITGKSMIPDEKALMMVQEFQQELNETEQWIDPMNQQRFVLYPYLKPSLVPNSFSA